MVQPGVISTVPLPHRIREELNSDLMVIISKPKERPLERTLRLPNALVSSSAESYMASDYEGSMSRDRKNFNYPPDLRTAQKMIE